MAAASLISTEGNFTRAHPTVDTMTMNAYMPYVTLATSGLGQVRRYSLARPQGAAAPSALL